ncbi:MAG: carbamoyltransferase HypF [Sedimenticola sp.]|nr:carbamoyltransferase HypF [Sedimenticola sp.]
MSTTHKAERIRVRGLVQGVGFRPTVWNLANRLKLQGAVWNDSEGVVIDVVGKAEQISELIHLLQQQPPPLAKIESIECSELSTGVFYNGFTIIESQGGRVQTGVVADAATCAACLVDINDPDNRRYGYAFTNCTHCGPRLSIIKSIPYDRATTSMAVFQQCETCLSEYTDPANRRFHAQPNACAKCGPSLWLEDVSGVIEGSLQAGEAIRQTAALIKSGAIVAIKGIGGVHLACDAMNAQAVTRLRDRKRRYHKAFALMAKDQAMITRFASLNPTEQALLESVAAPIVVLDQTGSEKLPSAVAPGQNTLGFMLPYTPLHHLLMTLLDHPIILTSGNQSDEPQVIGNAEACDRLASIADYWLLHDREIVNRLDDSVVRVVDGQRCMLRRARGYAPEPLTLPRGFEQAPSIVALGGELKNTFCLVKQNQAIVSQHMGDLENAATLAEYQRTLKLYHELYEHQPEVVVIDRHPNYLSSQWGESFAAESVLPLLKVQHHHAHIASTLAEQGYALDGAPVLGIALDGLGMGEDGALWGGEFLQVDYLTSDRLGYFKPIAMLGGAKAMYEPWRNTLAYLMSELNWTTVTTQYSHLELIQFLQSKPIKNLQQMLDRGLNSPTASSCGRLFDAVAAAIGICREQASHEGQAAIEMEALVERNELGLHAGRYSGRTCQIEGQIVIDWQPLWSTLLEDLSAGVDASRIAARFHSGLIQTVVKMTVTLCKQQQLNTVVLSGGVFQNRIILEGVSQQLREHSLQVMSPSRYPANDGGLSLGQAVIAAARALKKVSD